MKKNHKRKRAVLRQINLKNKKQNKNPVDDSVTLENYTGD
jgi:hypothetical protein